MQVCGSASVRICKCDLSSTSPPPRDQVAAFQGAQHPHSFHMPQHQLTPGFRFSLRPPPLSIAS
eukprot:1139245-Pelagomonas_calceolata.AAC.5